MAAPTYATDLTDISTCENATNFTYTSPGATGAPAQETDFVIQGTYCISKPTASTWKNSTRGGIVYNNGSGVTIPSPGGFFCWMYWWGPGVLATEAADGAGLVIGSAASAFKNWAVRGSDTWQFGGWYCAVVDPGAGIAADYTAGSPTATLQYFGWEALVTAATAIGKGNPYGLDVMRYGRGELRCTNGDLANGYCTFDGAAAFDNNSTRRWGLLTPQNGAYYQQGLFLFGLAATAVDFRDSNRAIFIQNTKKVAAGFNAFEVRNASSNVALSAVSIQALGTVSRGNWITTNDATVSLDGCVFTDMGTFGHASKTTATSTTYRRCNLVTQNSATFSKCTFDRTNDSTKALLCNNPAAVTNCTFISSGTKHAIELTAACAGNSYSFTGHTFTGYATVDGSTGNEVLYNNSGGSVTLTVSGLTGTLSVRNGAGASTTIVSGAVTSTVTVKTPAGANLQDARVLVIAAAGGPMPSDVTVTISNSGTTATVTHNGHGMVTSDKVQIKGASLQANNGVYSITKIDANSYSYTMGSTPGSNPTGTIKATYVALSGLTDVNGQISMSRSFTSSQPVTGRVRKSTSSPLYKTADVTGTIDSANGFSSTIQMIPDE